MSTFCIPRKSLSLVEGAESLRKWTSVDKDVEVMFIKEKSTYSVLSYVICPPEDPQEEDDLLFGLYMFQTEDLNEAEIEFNSYTSNFLGDLT